MEYSELASSFKVPVSGQKVIKGKNSDLNKIIKMTRQIDR